MIEDEGNATVSGDQDDLGPEQSDTPPHDSAPEEVIPESPDGAEENEGDPEKPDFGDYTDEGHPDQATYTEDHADFDADEPELVPSEPVPGDPANEAL